MLVWVAVAFLAELGGIMFLMLRRLHHIHSVHQLFPSQIPLICLTQPHGAFISSAGFLGFRVLYLLFSIAVLCDVAVSSGISIFAYFTLWNYMLQTAYFSMAVLTSFGMTTGLNKHDWIGRFMLITIGVNLTFSTVITIVTWLVLLPQAYSTNSQHEFLSFTSFAKHLINIPALYFEFGANRFTISPTHLPTILLWASGYGLFALGYQAVGGPVLYFFADADDPMSLVFITCVLMFSASLFWVACAVSRFKERICSPGALIIVPPGRNGLFGSPTRKDSVRLTTRGPDLP